MQLKNTPLLIKIIAVSLFFIHSSAAHSQCTATDSMVMGPNYQNDVFYSFEYKTVLTAPNNNWHLAFAVRPSQFPSNPANGVAIRVNNAYGYKLKMLPNANPANWRSIDTSGLKALPELVDSDSTWNLSAFTKGYPGTDIFNFIWGGYNGVTKNIEGSKVFILTNDSAVYKKVFIKLLVFDTLWNVIISNLDNSDSVNFTINKRDYPGKMFAYYNIHSKLILDREPHMNSWDLLLTRYRSWVTVPGFGSAYYNVTGILQNPAVTAAKNTDKTCPNIHVNGSKPFTSMISTVGWDWKIQPPPAWVIVDTFVYFVKAVDQDVYKLSFVSFGGSANGKATFFSGNVLSVPGIANQENNLKVYPNPGTISLTADLKEDITDAKILTSNGVLLNAPFSGHQISIEFLPCGLYNLMVETKKGKHSAIFIKQ